MATRIVALFNLKPGISVADYEAWAKTVDLPTVNGLGSIEKFEVFRSAGLLGSDARPPFAYIEIIDVKDMDAFGGDVATDAMQRIAAEFQGMVDDLSFILTERLG
ncbi:MAG: REDY-like protein HapK [Alphaproteobacteria bacterium]|nr:REDY-like protein HapK [Alphaproteobacteria bacterium]